MIGPALSRPRIRAGRWLAGAACLLVLAACTGSPESTGIIGSPPTPGSIEETVPAVSPGDPLKVGLKDEAVVSGLKIRIESIESKTVKSNLPGENSGPALLVNLTLRNDSGAAYPTDQLEVNLLDSDGNAASRVIDEPAKSFEPSIAAGAEAKATYVFVIPKDQRNPVSLTVSVAAGQQAAVFSGNAG